VSFGTHADPWGFSDHRVSVDGTRVYRWPQCPGSWLFAEHLLSAKIPGNLYLHRVLLWVREGLKKHFDYSPRDLGRLVVGDSGRGTL